MTQRSAILQKKLHEIESELSDIFRLSPEKTTPAADHIYFDDVEQRIEFLKNLYSAEVSSQPPQNTTDELLQTGQRLAAVEASFREWNASRTHMDDALSVCSDCTQSLLLDEGREPEKLLMVKEEEEMPENLSTENVVKKESVPEREDAADGGGGRRIWGRIGRYFGVFGGGILFGAICVGNCEKLFSDFFAQYEVFVDLPPT